MITVAGGVYLERCLQPHWDEVYGSAGRAAAALSATGEVKLHTYRAADLADGIDNLGAIYGLSVDGPATTDGVAFEYVHPLAAPRIAPRPDVIAQQPPLEVEDDVVVRFGMLEGTARVRARRAVYDPQSAFGPESFHSNGSRADELAVILNRSEARQLTGLADPQDAAQRLLSDAAVVVVKSGSRGALVTSREGSTLVPAYQSGGVFKIGSGDVFSAAFAQFWGVDGMAPTAAADLASRATSVYCDTRSLPIPPRAELEAMELEPVCARPSLVYLAAPFFDLGQRWLVEEAREHLLAMGVEVFSPLHDIGPGPGSYVAPLDLAGLDRSHAVLAVLNGADVGTVFEVGYAVAKGKPVVALAQNMRPEDLKMIDGSGCYVIEDFASAIYRTAWSL